jgi:hypothetical protein
MMNPQTRAYILFIAVTPLLSLLAWCGLDQSANGGRIIYLVPAFTLVAFCMASREAKRPMLHVVVGIILLPALWLVNILIVGMIGVAQHGLVGTQ